MFNWLETQSGIPESLHLWIEIGVVVVAAVVLLGLAFMVLGLVLSLVRSGCQLCRTFWRWCFLAPMELAKGWWPRLDGAWFDWRQKVRKERHVRISDLKYRKAMGDKATERVEMSFLLDKATLQVWELGYLVQRKGGETFTSWFAGKMESLAMTSALTADQAFLQTPEEER